MEDRPSHDRDIDEAMEVCRPGSDDISDPAIAFLSAELAAHPELDERYEQIQRLDGKLAAAFGQVSLPAGLADRIMARLALARLEETSPDEVEATISATTDAVDSPPDKPAAPARASRRWLLATAGTLLAAASVLVIVLVSSSGPGAMTRESVIQEAVAQFDRSGAARQANDVKTAPKNYPFSAELASSNTISWRWVSGFLGRDGVAYDMASPDGTKATLYVIRGTAPGMPETVNTKPDRSAATDQHSVSAWQSNGLVYVLVVDGGPGKFQRFLNQGPVT
jgi:hypothetical protein